MPKISYFNEIELRKDTNTNQTYGVSFNLFSNSYMLQNQNELDRYSWFCWFKGIYDKSLNLM
jgi:hypothetical protein